tara:strand:+ start:4856 stop:5029 length:174 start_codon:yes stop_codon:yes gene_type:complete
MKILNCKNQQNIWTLLFLSKSFTLIKNHRNFTEIKTNNYDSTDYENQMESEKKKVKL